MYLTIMLSVHYSIRHRWRENSWLVNWKVTRRKWSWPIRRTIQVFIWTEKQQNISFRTDALRAEIRKKHHTNIYQEYYHATRTNLYSLCVKTALRDGETAELNSTRTYLGKRQIRTTRLHSRSFALRRRSLVAIWLNSGQISEQEIVLTCLKEGFRNPTKAGE